MHEHTMIDALVAELEADDLEPLVLAKVSEATAAAACGSDDDDNVVWGNF
ncbi:MAG: hypothetical protein AB1635_20855 [Acidobacteriota bacterium]